MSVSVASDNPDFCVNDGRKKAKLVAKFFSGSPKVPASDFIENNQAESIMNRINTQNTITDDDRLIIFQFLADFSNWSHYADKYIEHYSYQGQFLRIL